MPGFKIPEAMLHTVVMNTNFTEQLETLEALGTAEDIQQLKIQKLMHHLVYAAPSRPSWEDSCLKPPPPGMYC